MKIEAEASNNPNPLGWKKRKEETGWNPIRCKQDLGDYSF